MLLRETWGEFLNADSNYEIIGECKNGEPAIRICQQNPPDVILFDITNPMMNEIDICKSILDVSKNTKILAVSQYTHSSCIRKAMSNGISGYLTKNSTCNEMNEAIQELAQGQKYICREARDILADELITVSKPRPSLSPREKEIVQLISYGRSSKEIAWQLNLSVKTVEVHRYNILHKLELKNTAALVNYLYVNNAGLN